MGGLAFGTLVLLYGQWIWGMSFRTTKPQLAPIIMSRILLSVWSLIFAMYRLQGESLATTISLIAYCILGMPFVAVIHQHARKGHEGAPRLGGLSDAERAAMNMGGAP